MQVSRTGWVDDESQLPEHIQKCPNCKSDRFLVAVSVERCSSCGYEINYWHGGANAVALAYGERCRQEQEMAEYRRDMEEQDCWREGMDYQQWREAVYENDLRRHRRAY